MNPRPFVALLSLFAACSQEPVSKPEAPAKPNTLKVEYYTLGRN